MPEVDPDQAEINAQHPEEWVKFQQDIQEWICMVLNYADHVISIGLRVRSLDRFIEENPAPLPPNQR